MSRERQRGASERAGTGTCVCCCLHLLSWRCEASRQRSRQGNHFWLWMQSRGGGMLSVIMSFDGGSVKHEYVGWIHRQPTKKLVSLTALHWANLNYFVKFLFFFLLGWKYWLSSSSSPGFHCLVSVFHRDVSHPKARFPSNYANNVLKTTWIVGSIPEPRGSDSKHVAVSVWMKRHIQGWAPLGLHCSPGLCYSRRWGAAQRRLLHNRKPIGQRGRLDVYNTADPHPGKWKHAHIGIEKAWKGNQTRFLLSIIAKESVCHCTNHAKSWGSVQNGYYGQTLYNPQPPHKWHSAWQHGQGLNLFVCMNLFYLVKCVMCSACASSQKKARHGRFRPVKPLIRTFTWPPDSLGPPGCPQWYWTDIWSLGSWEDLVLIYASTN